MLGTGRVFLLGKTAWFHCATENGTQLKSWEIFIYRIFYLIFLNCHCLQVNGILKSKITNKEWEVSVIENK